MLFASSQCFQHTSRGATYGCCIFKLLIMIFTTPVDWNKLDAMVATFFFLKDA